MNDSSWPYSFESCHISVFIAIIKIETWVKSESKIIQAKLTIILYRFPLGVSIRVAAFTYKSSECVTKIMLVSTC